MTKLYVANTTKQNHEFWYRLPEAQRVTMQKIAAGGQELIYKDASAHDLENIIKDHAAYGLIPVSEIDRTKAFIGLCYQFDNPVEVEKIMVAAAHNDTVLDQVSLESRKAAAAAIETSIREVDGNGLNAFETQVVEQTKPGDDRETMDETIEIVQPGAKGSRRKSKG